MLLLMNRKKGRKVVERGKSLAFISRPNLQLPFVSFYLCRNFLYLRFVVEPGVRFGGDESGVETGVNVALMHWTGRGGVALGSGFGFKSGVEVDVRFIEHLIKLKPLHPDITFAFKIAECEIAKHIH